MGRQAIIDEFTSLNISRQRRFQLRRNRDGLCRICSAPVETAETGDQAYCPRHRQKQRDYSCTSALAPSNPQDKI